MNKVAVVIWIYITGVCCFFSCSNGKKIADNNNKQEITENTMKPEFAVSARTKQFLADLEKELKTQDLQDFTPSGELMTTYNIKKRDGQYYISGFIKTGENFDKTVFENSGVTFGQPSGKIITLTIPLYFLPDFLSNKEIEYFEISGKVQTKQ